MQCRASINKLILKPTWLTAWQMKKHERNRKRQIRFNPSTEADWASARWVHAHNSPHYGARWHLSSSHFAHAATLRCLVPTSAAKFIREGRKESASSHEVRVITILFRERSEIQSDRERHEMFIYCFYHHVNHLNGSYVMKICREGKAENEMRVWSNWFLQKVAKKILKKSEDGRSRFELSTTCDYMQIYRFPFKWALHGENNIDGGRPY